MAFDGAFLACIRQEIGQLSGCRVDKLYQPTRDELVLLLRGREGTVRLLLSAASNGARAQRTECAIENPRVPPMFCMLLRKKLVGARLAGVHQPGLERLLVLSFDARDDFGDDVQLHLQCELMGRHSNVILTDGEGRIIDALRRTDAQSTRIILPGARYQPPAPSDRVDLLLRGADAATAAVVSSKAPLADALTRGLQGLSGVVCRELAHKVLRGDSQPANELTAEQIQRLTAYLNILRDTIAAGKAVPTLIQEPSGRPVDFTFLSVSQYGTGAITRTLESCSELLDAFYGERERQERRRRRAQDIFKLLSSTTARVSRRIQAQQDELKATADRERLRIYGELIKANLHRIEKGISFCEVPNYYTPDCAMVRIPLNIALSPSQNAQQYFRKYRKATTASHLLVGLIDKGEQELHYLDSVFDALARAETDDELAEIRDELTQQGYFRRSATGRQKEKRPPKLPARRFMADDGTVILVGRSNRQNDTLTLRESHSHDVWFHVKNDAGAHVVAKTDGKAPSREVCRQAAILAATYSRCAQSTGVPVDFTQIKYVKKPSGAPPGMVTYTHHETIFVDPDPVLCQHLAQT